MKNVLILILFFPIFLSSCFKDKYPCESHLSHSGGWNYPMTFIPPCYNDYYVKKNIQYPTLMFSRTNGDFAFIQNDTIFYYNSNKIFLNSVKLSFTPFSIFYRKGNNTWFNPKNISDRIYAIDSSGILINTIYKLSNEEIGLITNDNGYVSRVNSTNNLRKYSQSGNLEWSLDSVFTSPSDNFASNYFHNLTNGDFIYIHQDRGWTNDSTYISICRITINKNIKWKTKLSIPGSGSTLSFTDQDKVTILYGDTIFRLDSSGMVIFKGKSNINTSHDLFMLNDGNLIQLYIDRYDGPPVSLILYKYDSNGQLVWSKKIHTDNDGGYNYIYQTNSDNNFILTVMPVYDGKHCYQVSSDLLFIKTDSEGNTCY